MQDLSLHLLDIAENSIRAQATEIKIKVIEDLENNFLKLVISDNGRGMSAQMVREATNPFITTRTLRKVGLGIPLLYQNCLNAEGDLKIESQKGKGTTLEAWMKYSHINRLPLGDIAESLSVLIQANPHVAFIYQHIYQQKTFLLQTTEIRKILEDVPIDSPEIIWWLKGYIKENLSDLYR